MTSRRATESERPYLKLAPGIFSGEMVRGVIDECIVPALVQNFLKTKKVLQESREEADNGGRQT